MRSETGERYPRVRGPCGRCREPGACCRSIALSMEFPLDVDRDEVRRHIRNGTNRPGFPACDEKLPFEPLARNHYYAKRGHKTPTSVRWLFTCPELSERGRCKIYRRRPRICRRFEPLSDPLCVEFRGPWTGRMRCSRWPKP